MQIEYFKCVFIIIIFFSKNGVTSKADLRAYFKRKAAGSDGPVAKRQIASPEMIIPPIENVNRAEIEMVIDVVKKPTARKNHHNSIPKHIGIEVGMYVLDRSTKDALEKFSKQYPKFYFKRTSINSWKILLTKSGGNQTFSKKGRPNLLLETLLNKRKDVIVVSRLAGTVISRRMIITIGTKVVKAKMIQVKLLHL